MKSPLPDLLSRFRSHFYWEHSCLSSGVRKKNLIAPEPDKGGNVMKRTILSFLFSIIMFLFFSCNVNDPGNNDRFNAGPILFVSDKSGTWQLWSMNEDGSDVTQLTHDPNFPITDARWSPDGSQIVYAVAYDSQRRAKSLFIMNADGTKRYRLTNSPSPSIDYSPIWSPDGKRVAFTRLSPGVDGGTTIFIIDVDGKNERQLTSDRNPVSASWTPDGRYLLISTISYSEGKGRIAFIDLEGNYVRTLTPEEAKDNAPLLSPDGQSIAFNSIGIRNGVTGRFLHLMNSHGSNRRQLLLSIHPLEWPIDWSPDGQRILCMTQDPNSRSVPSDPYSNFPQDILIVNVADGSVRTVTPFPHREAYSRATSWRRR